MGKMKLLMLMFAVWPLMQVTAYAAILEVIIQPDTPDYTEVITIIITGEEGTGPVEISDSIFSVDDNQLELNLTIANGPYTVMSPWAHQEDIGTLSIGIYELNVNTINSFNDTDTFFTSFEVVPEPASILLISGGLFGVLGKRKMSR